MKPRVLPLVAFLLLVASAFAADAPARREWTIDGVVREALVYVPASATTKPAPVIFAFHGHGGNMRNPARTWAYHTLWPEAIVVYPQGLKTPGRLTDPAGKLPGWQHAGGVEGDRDLKFFDEMLASLRKDYRVDDHRIYSTGHSNGGGFTYLLWAERGDQFAAMAPAAAVAAQSLAKLKPKPVWHLAGRKDPLVKFEWQEQTIAALRKLNQCGEGQPVEGTLLTNYPSKIDAPVVTYIHDGGHEFPAAKACPLIVEFFKQHTKL
jgi:polyhydroxybutyrate depolymerase